MANDSVVPEGFEVERGAIPDGFVIEAPARIPEGFAAETGVDAAKAKRRESIAGESNVEAAGRRFTDAAGDVIQGSTLGLSDEIQSVIAATVSAPFISDKTFGQLMVDARKSLRDEREARREDSPVVGTLPVIGDVTAQGALEFAGGAATAGPKLIAGTVKGAAALGATAGAGFTDAEDFVSVDTAIGTAVGASAGAALGVLVPKAVGALTRAVRRVTGKSELRIFDESGQFTGDALDELRKVDATPAEIQTLMRRKLVDEGVLTREQAARYNLFTKQGVTPTRANVTQTVDDSLAQQSAVKRSGPVAERVAQQDLELTGAVSEQVSRLSPRASTLPETNANVFAVVDDVVTEADEVVGAAYTAAREAAKGQARVTLDRFSNALSDQRGSERISGGVISATRGLVRNKGALRTGVSPSIDKRAPRLKPEQTRKITVEDAEGIRQGLNSLHDSVTPQGRRIIRELKGALDDDVADAVGVDIFQDARAEKIRFQALIERGRRNKFDKTKGGFLEDVIDNKIPEEKIVPRLLAGRDDDFLKFKDFLTGDAGDAGVAAWNDIRAQTLRNALDRATSVIGKGEKGQGVFNARLFRNEINKLKGTKKYRELYNAEERQFIGDIIEIGQLRVPISSVAQGKGPSELVGQSIKREIARRIPLVGERAIDLVESVANLRQDRAVLDVTGATAKRLAR